MDCFLHCLDGDCGSVTGRTANLDEMWPLTLHNVQWHQMAIFHKGSMPSRMAKCNQLTHLLFKRLKSPNVLLETYLVLSTTQWRVFITFFDQILSGCALNFKIFNSKSSLFISVPKCTKVVNLVILPQHFIRYRIHNLWDGCTHRQTNASPAFLSASVFFGRPFYFSHSSYIVD